MTGVYEHALGAAADDLHPKVRERYAVDADDDTIGLGRGRMDITRGTHVLPALYPMTALNLLFPEAGHDVPFTVRTAGFREGGHEALATIREFEFEGKRRRFDSLTVWDSERERLFDFLGTGGHLVSELQPRVEAGVLVVESGAQWLRMGGRYRRIPDPLAASVEVRDRYDETGERYHVDATIENPLAGHILSYRGTFTQESEPTSTVPDDLRPTSGLDRLPPG
ncbi:DUF4166 domain-containing protein [Halococcus sp. IIIV-5B]|uniref:DUF4166 domain-containing protein n=1 Tax=Halococcus sp. IIIV-5B TaxID=2321230 RepID=UPI000E72506A|nr:DUF4166 domain-containing protein [Halococcus sp. IIIV-5B]RJT01165.1 DUF4166 domain-containing protein [Halococcus sp. IIIV-5B]